MVRDWQRGGKSAFAFPLHYFDSTCYSRFLISSRGYICQLGTKGVSCASSLDYWVGREPGILQGHLALAVVSTPAPEQVEHGYALLAQAHLEAESATRERLLTAAIAAFKAAYQSEPIAACHAGAGAAWRSPGASARAVPTTGVSVPVASHTAATRRKKSTAGAGAATGQCCCRLPARPRLLAPGHPGRGAAAGCLQRSREYLTQAAGLGVPIHVSSVPARSDTPLTGFSVEDTVVALRYVDARGVGRMDDLIFVYRSAAHKALFACGCHRTAGVSTRHR